MAANEEIIKKSAVQIMTENLRKIVRDAFRYDATGKPDTTTPLRIEEPVPTHEKAKYTSIIVSETEGGHVIITDNTLDNKRYIVLHPAGSYTATVDSGAMVDHCTHDRITIVDGERQIAIHGDKVEIIEGSHKLVIEGNKDEMIGGDHNKTIGGNVNNITKANYNIIAEGIITIKTPSYCTIEAGACFVEAQSVDVSAIDVVVNSSESVVVNSGTIDITGTGNVNITSDLDLQISGESITLEANSINFKRPAG